MQVDPKKVQEIEWVERLMSMPWWPDIEARFESEAELLRESAFSISSTPTQDQINLLRACGMEPPKNSEEQQQVFIAFRAVANYVTHKMKTLVANREIYRQGVAVLKQQEAEMQPQETLK